MRVLFIIAQRNFHDEEFNIPKKILEESENEVVVASIEKEEAVSVKGTRLTPDIEVRTVNPSDYAMLVLIGGSGAPKLAEYPEVLDVIRRFNEQKKPIGGICLGSYVLARAGVLTGKKATVYPADFALAEFTRAGINYSEKGVIKDGRIITADSPKSAENFGRELLKILSESNK